VTLPLLPFAIVDVDIPVTHGEGWRSSGLNKASDSQSTDNVGKSTLVDSSS